MRRARKAVGWLGRAVLWPVLACLLVSAARPGEMLGGALGRIQARFSPEYDPWMVMAQYLRGRGLDLIVVSLGRNDCMNDGQPSGLYRYPPPGVRPVNRLLHRSNLVLVLRGAVLAGYRWTSAIAGAIARTPRIDAETFREHLAETVSVARGAGANALLVVEPRIDRILAREGAGTDACAAYVEALERLSRDAGVPLLDPGAGWSLGEAAEFFIDDVHLERPAYELFVVDDEHARPGHAAPHPPARPRAGER